jgi:hypothetical protein
VLAALGLRPDKSLGCIDHGQSTTVDSIAAALSVQERVLLFCLGSDTDWAKAGVPAIIAQHLLVRNLVERKDAAQLALTDQGRAVQAALVMPP